MLDHRRNKFYIHNTTNRQCDMSIISKQNSVIGMLVVRESAVDKVFSRYYKDGWVADVSEVCFSLYLCIYQSEGAWLSG